MSHEQHQAALLSAFADVLKAEHFVAETKTDLAEKTARLKASIAEGEAELAAAWATIAALMAETGETKVTLPGSATDYRIGWSTPQESVVGDPNAAPDEFVAVERRLKKKEVAAHLRLLRDHQNMPMPNWGRLESGEKRLTWQAVKRT